MFKDIRFVLVETSLPANVGAAARAMKTMGLHQLYLVSPKQFPDPSAIALAAGADDLLTHAKVFASLSDATADCHLVIGMSARARNIDWPTLTLDEMALRILQCEGKSSVVFGSERNGLSNTQLQQCHYHVQIPSDPTFSSLNLAAAVQIVAYVLRRHAEVDVVDFIKKTNITQADFDGLIIHFETTLKNLRVIDPDYPRDTLARLKRLLLRADLDRNELGLLHCILHAVDKLGML